MIKKIKIVFVFFAMLVFLPTLGLSQMISVSGEDVNMRSGPGKNYSIKWKYGSGFPLKVIQQKGNWIKVEDFENDVGWLHKSLISKSGYLVVKVNKGTNKKVNIRNGPGTKYSVIGKAYYGVVFKTLEQKKGWAKVKHESGIVGWVKRSLLWGF